MRKSPSLDRPALSQRDRFIDTARALGANEAEAAFKAKLASIAWHKSNEIIELEESRDD